MQFAQLPPRVSTLRVLLDICLQGLYGFKHLRILEELTHQGLRVIMTLELVDGVEHQALWHVYLDLLSFLGLIHHLNPHLFGRQG